MAAHFCDAPCARTQAWLHGTWSGGGGLALAALGVGLAPAPAAGQAGGRRARLRSARTACAPINSSDCRRGRRQLEAMADVLATLAPIGVLLALLASAPGRRLA